MQAQDQAVTALSVLGDQVRRRLYEFISAARRPVSREEAAAGTGISRKLAAFHLDKLVEAGLLSARYQPREGVRRPGRAPKVYELAQTEFSVSIPPRHHDLLADILVNGVLSQSPGEQARTAAMRAAAAKGRDFGGQVRAQLRPGRLGPERSLALAAQILSDGGFEPEQRPGEVRLRNCPFHPLAARAPGLVCAINHAYLRGLLEGLEARAVEAVLRPEPGACCVALVAVGG